MGKIKLELGDYERAAELFDDAIKKKPNDARVWLEKGRALSRLGESREAMACFDKALELGLSKVKESRALSEKGWTLFRERKYEEASQFLDCSLEIDQGFAEAWCLKGTILIQDDIRRYKDALTCFDNTIEILKENPNSQWVELAREGKEIAEHKLMEQKNMAEGEKPDDAKKPQSKRFFKRLFG